MLKDIYDKSRQLAYLNTAIHLNDDRFMIVENCNKILDYSDIYISLNNFSLKIFVWGKDLKIDDFDTDCIRINGSIQSVQFSR